MTERSRQPISIRWKVTALIVLPMLLVLAISTTLGYTRQRKRTFENMSMLASQTGQVIEHALERDMLVSDFDRIQETLDSISQDERVQTLYILDTDGNISFAPSGANTPSQLDNSDATCQPCHQYPAADRPSGVVVPLASGQHVFRSMHPIENQPACARCHDPEEPLIGLLLTDFSIEPVETAITLELQENLFWLVGTVVATAFLSSFAVNRWVLQRLRKLAAAMEGIGLHGLADRLPTKPTDEIGRLSAAFNAMADRVERREEQNLELSEALERRAEERGHLLRRLLKTQEEERIRVARELHDELGQTLSSSALTIEVSQRALAQGEEEDVIKRHLDSAHRQIADATDHMYDLIMGLRPSVLDDLGLVAGLRTLAERILEPAEIGFEIEADLPQQRLPATIETALFRIFQEAMTNVHKHAQAHRVQIRVRAEDGWVEGKIVDDGTGFDPAASPDPSENGGLGLVGIRERASQLGGETILHARPREGTTLIVRLPLPEQDDD